MYTLFIDTHSKKVVVVLYKDGKILCIKEKTSENHSSVLMPLISEVLSEVKIETNDLNEIIVVDGPGSFTGIRIGITVAKTLAYVLNIKIKVIDYFNVLLASSNFNGKKQICISDPKGYYVGLFDESNKASADYYYVSAKNFELNVGYTFVDESINIDYEKVYLLSEDITDVNPHGIKPLYIKKIGVEK